jgi:hypothetical protein
MLTDEREFSINQESDSDKGKLLLEDLDNPQDLKQRLIKQILQELPLNQEYISYENKVLIMLEKKLENLFDSILHKTEMSINRYLKSIEKTIYEEKLLSQKIESLINNKYNYCNI